MFVHPIIRVFASSSLTVTSQKKSTAAAVLSLLSSNCLGSLAGAGAVFNVETKRINEEERTCNQTETVNSALCRCPLSKIHAMTSASSAAATEATVVVAFPCLIFSLILQQRSSCYCSFCCFCFMTNRKGKEHNTLLIRCLSSIFVPASTQVPAWLMSIIN